MPIFIMIRGFVLHFWLPALDLQAWNEPIPSLIFAAASAGGALVKGLAETVGRYSERAATVYDHFGDNAAMRVRRVKKIN